MSLGPDGGDPDGIKLRAAEGFEAIDYFVANYWVFAKAVQALADIGYDSSSMRPVKRRRLLFVVWRACCVLMTQPQTHPVSPLKLK